jgi:hypothetical protein
MMDSNLTDATLLVTAWLFCGMLVFGWVSPHSSFSCSLWQKHDF